MPKWTKYNSGWEEKFKCLKAGPSEYEALCTDCGSNFSIKNGGRSDVKKHCNGSKHKKNYKKLNDNSVNIGDNSVNVNDENNVFKLTPQEEVIMAETVQALKVVSSNYSFSSTTDDSDDFRRMFPDSVIAQKYHQSKTKVNYVIKHGISPYVKDLYINYFNGTPFVFKFDETTTLQVKKKHMMGIYNIGPNIFF